ncbi:hypothetical protein ABFY48_01705 [Lysinibacillus pakistanensis]|uniref:hypothetical protein n=1 Tax=Lysinibacillus pakistanensis TaxID=759811 RepID=UPI003D2656D1
MELNNISFEEATFRPLPQGIDVSASSEQTKAQLAVDGNPTTYWLGLVDFATFRIYFTGGREWISAIRIKTWYINARNAEFTIYGKEDKGSPSIKIGYKIVPIEKFSPNDPQSIDIDVKWGQYDLLEIQVGRVPIINEIEIF